MVRKKKDNPGFVTRAMCNQRYGQLNSNLKSVNGNVKDILFTLKGNPKKYNDMGLLGEVRDIRRDRRWVYALIVMLGVPCIILLISYLLGV